jgi:LmbE family N-acetylglucosaminyl deacetylase
MSTILVISPHPDDESIGCGGTLRKHIVEGDKVEVIFLTSGEKGGHGKPEDETKKIREKEAYSAAAILQLSGIEFWQQPDGDFQSTQQNIVRLKNKIAETKADIIYAPHQNEQHPDHIQAAVLAIKAVTLLDSIYKKPTLLMYEVWTPIQKIDHIVDISDCIEIKRKAILAYKSQCDVLQFDEAILALNRYRGEMHSWPGGDYAEVFTQPN